MFPKLRERNYVNKNLDPQTVQPGITYAQSLNLNNQQPNNTNPLILQQPNNDIAELKSMMKDLISQMGTMMNLITTLIDKIKQWLKY